MNSEGKGIHAPGITVVTLSEADHRFIECIANERSGMKYTGSADQWKAGLVTGVSGTTCTDPSAMPIVVGTTGELAVKAFIESRVHGRAINDTRFYAGRGDGDKDVIAAGLSIQVKTRKKLNGQNLIRRMNERGYVYPLRSECYCFATLTDCNVMKPVRLLGWAWRKDVERMRVDRSPIGPWKNIVVRDEDLRPMSALVSEIEFRMEMGTWH